MKVLLLHNYPANINGSQAFLDQGFVGLKKIKSIEILDVINITDYFKEYGLLMGFIKLRQVVKNYDLIHSQYGGTCGFLSSFLPCRSKVISIKGSDFYLLPWSVSFFGHFRSLLSSILTVVSLFRFDSIVVMSNRMSNHIVLKYFKKKTIVIPDCIDLEMFKPIDKLKARAKLGKKNDFSSWILFSSVFGSKVKRFEFAQAIYDDVLLKNSNIQFILLTGIPHDQIPLYISASDVILLTSYTEGWPNIIKEGLACNVPFVSSDVSDLSYIANQTNNCFIFRQTEKSEKVADLILRSLYSDKNCNLRAFAQNFEMVSISKRMYEVYMSVTGIRIN